MTIADLAPDVPPPQPPEPTAVPPADSLAQLARLSGCPADRIGGYVALGLLDGSDLCLADTTAIRLIDSLESAGLPAAALAQAVRDGQFSFRFARSMVAQPTAMSGRTYRQVLAELELDEGIASAVFAAAGLPFIDLDRQVRADDLAFLSILSRAVAAGLRPTALVRASRVFGHALRRIAEAQRDLFRAEVEEPLMASGLPIGAMLDATSHLRPALQSLGFDAVQVLLHRILEDLVFENIAIRLHATLADLGLMAPNGERLGVVGFADMSGFTQFVAEAGDRQGADMAARLEEVVAGILDRSAGRVIKAMGDGLLVHFHRPAAAVPVASAIVEKAAAAGLLPVHVGLAAGTVLFRDGDIFGATVNRAARLAGQANPGCVLVDDTVRRLNGEAGGAWETVNLGPLKGLAEIPAFRWMPSKG